MLRGALPACFERAKLGTESQPPPLCVRQSSEAGRARSICSGMCCGVCCGAWSAVAVAVALSADASIGKWVLAV